MGSKVELIVKLILQLLGAISAMVGITGLVLQIIRLRQGPTWRDALRKARKVLDRINQSNWDPTVVIGIGRSGGIWGGWLAGNLGSKPFLGVEEQYVPNPHGRKVHFPGAERVLSALEEFRKFGSNVLLVEGASSTGQTFTCFMERFSDQLDSWNIKKAVLYKNPAAAIDIDFVGKSLERWPERFPWHDRRGKWRRYLKNGSNNKPWL
jgi:hypoxanthine phosphoribosyltransferase